MHRALTLEANKEVLNYLANLGYDPQYGARPLKRVMQTHLLNDLSKAILSRDISKNSVVGVTLDENKNLQFFNVDEVKL